VGGRTQQRDDAQEEDAEENSFQEETDEDDCEDQMSSPTPVRQKKSKHSARRPPGVDLVSQRRHSTYRQSKKRPLEDIFPQGTSSKRSKAVKYMDNEFQTPVMTTTTTETPINLSLWEEWDMKRSAMMKDNRHSDHSVKAVRVWKGLYAKYSPRLSRSRKGQETFRVKFDKICLMVLGIANVYSFLALREVMGLLQQDSAAWTSEIFSNDPKVLLEAVGAFETAGHLNSYIRRFTLARLANVYLETAANGGRLTLDNDPACSFPRTGDDQGAQSRDLQGYDTPYMGRTIPYTTQWSQIDKTRLH
jgi:hypothetical protein